MDELQGMKNEEPSPVASDPRLLREALAQYRLWNEAEFVERVRNAGKKTPADKWQEYKEMYALLQRIKPEASRGEQIMASKEWEAYYEQIGRFEKQRQSRG